MKTRDPTNKRATDKLDIKDRHEEVVATKAPTCCHPPITLSNHPGLALLSINNVLLPPSINNHSPPKLLSTLQKPPVAILPPWT